MNWVEIMNALMKGLGMRPTRYLLRWAPTLFNPFGFDLLEVMRCGPDGEIMTYKKAQSPLGVHAGHRINSPGRFSLFEFFMVQLRIVQ